MLSKDYPDHHDADLVIKLYELRREATMRESRNAINQQFWPKSFDDVIAVTRSDHPLNAAFRQTNTYWEMVYGMARHGVVHAEFMMESCGEGLYLFARVSPYLEQYRASVNPLAFRNAEWVSKETETGRQTYERFQRRVQQVLATK